MQNIRSDLNLSHIKYIANNLGSQLIKRLEHEKIYVSLENAIDVFLQSDPTSGKKLVDWLVKTYCSGGFRWEDIQAGAESKVFETLDLYRKNYKKLGLAQRNLYEYTELGQVYNAVKPYIKEDIENTNLSNRLLKKALKDEVLNESIVLFRNQRLIVSIPLTERSSQWWGRGTRWCTAADKNNAFLAYNKDAPLIVITIPQANCNGMVSATKLQLWINLEEDYFDKMSFMDENDSKVSAAFVNDNWDILEPIIQWIFEQCSNGLEYIPKALRTIEMCWKAVETNGGSLAYVPEHMITDEMCRIAVSNKAWALSHVPISMRTPELCLLVAAHDNYLIDIVPKAAKTNDYYRHGVENGLALKNVPIEILDEEMCRIAIQNNGAELQSLPEKFKTQEFYKFAVNANPVSLYFVPMDYLTPELYRLAVEKCGLSLYDVPKELVTAELCMIAISENAKALDAIPPDLLTHEFCRIAVESVGALLQKVPDEFLDRELCWLAVKKDACTLQYVPEKFLSEKLCRLAVENTGNALIFVPQAMKTLDICTLAMSDPDFNPNSLLEIPERFRSKEIIETIRLHEKEISDVKNAIKWNINVLDGLSEHLITFHKNLQVENIGIYI